MKALKFVIETKLPGHQWTPVEVETALYRAERIAADVVGEMPEGSRARVVRMSTLAVLYEYQVWDEPQGTTINRKKGAAR